MGEHTIEIAVCPICRTAFKRIRGNQKYCCRPCTDKSGKVRKRKKYRFDSLSRNARLARAEGVTYGYYMSRHLAKLEVAND